jgi:hypothetical protein
MTTMSEYVRITTSPAEIMSVASQISDRGGELKDRIGTLNEAIAAHESPGEVFPSDQFTDPFAETYKQESTGADGKSTTANVAVRESALYCGQKLQDMGDFVSTAMMNYGAADDEGGADIRNTEV